MTSGIAIYLLSLPTDTFSYTFQHTSQITLLVCITYIFYESITPDVFAILCSPINHSLESICFVNNSLEPGWVYALDGWVPSRVRTKVHQIKGTDVCRIDDMVLCLMWPLMPPMRWEGWWGGVAGRVGDRCHVDTLVKFLAALTSRCHVSIRRITQSRIDEVCSFGTNDLYWVCMVLLINFNCTATVHRM